MNSMVMSESEGWLAVQASISSWLGEGKSSKEEDLGAGSDAADL